MFGTVENGGNDRNLIPLKRNFITGYNVNSFMQYI